MNSRHKIIYYIPIILLIFSLTACVNTARYSRDVYRRTVELKVESLHLIDQAKEPYQQHQKDVEELKIKLRKAYEFAKLRKNNEESAQQWALMIDESENLMGGVLKFWKKSGTLSPAFIKNTKEQLNQAFNSIIELEKEKIHR